MARKEQNMGQSTEMHTISPGELTYQKPMEWLHGFQSQDPLGDVVCTRVLEGPPVTHRLTTCELTTVLPPPSPHLVVDLRQTAY